MTGPSKSLERWAREHARILAESCDEETEDEAIRHTVPLRGPSRKLVPRPVKGDDS